MEQIQAAGYDITTVVIVTNTDDYKAVQLVRTGETKQGEKILTVS